MSKHDADEPTILVAVLLGFDETLSGYSLALIFELWLLRLIGFQR